jgi:hypothetical protein
MAARNIKLTAAEFAPKGRAWDDAPPALRRRYWNRFAELAIRIKRDEIRRGIGVDGKGFDPVQPASRPDGADGKPLDPHYAESRTYRLLAAQVHGDGVTLFWRGHGRKSWATILGYHADGLVTGAPKRNTIGISPRGTSKLKREAGDFWRIISRSPATAVTPAKPAAAPPAKPSRAAAAKPPAPPRPAPPPTPLFVSHHPRVVVLKPGQKFDPRSKSTKIFVKVTPDRSPKPAVPKPPASPRPRPVTSVARRLDPLEAIAAAPQSKAAAPRADQTAIQKAVAYANKHSVEIEPNGYDLILKAYGSPEKAATVHAVYESKRKKIFINQNSDYWQNPEKVAGRWRSSNFTSTDAADHAIVHEVGHALHHRADEAKYSELRKQGFSEAQKTKIEQTVGRYASTNPVELVAEVYAGLQNGKSYDKIIMAYYDKLKGPRP